MLFYYGGADGWCPLSYYEDVLSVHGDHAVNNIKLCSKGYDHAFVIKNSTEVAEIVADWTSTIGKDM